MDPLEQSVLRTVGVQRLLTQGQKVVVAVSGGPDSVALLFILHRLAPALELELHVGHVNHLLRGAESDAEEEFVRELACELGLPCQIRRQETEKAAASSKANLEDYARRMRYAFLFELADGCGSSLVATAHTANDVAETFLLKALRGAGISGLAGIYPTQPNVMADGSVVNVVRPLLGVSRAQILSYLTRYGRTFREDSSNRDLAFDRNAVRHELIPWLERRFNPEVVEVLGRTARLLREVEDFLEPILEAAFQQSRTGGEDEAVSLAVEALLAAHPLVQREGVRRAVREQKGDLRDITYQHVEDVLALARGQSGTEAHLPGGVRVRREFDRLVVGSPTPRIEFSYELSIPGDVYISEIGRRVTAKRVSLQTPPRPGAIRLNLPVSRLRLRNRRPGDRFRLKAESRPRRVKELLIEKRVPRSRRDQLLVLEDENQIVWIEGFEPDPSFRVEQGSREVAEIELSLKLSCDSGF
jgi:tRNA(Ile)-lysidine synthase